MGKSGAKEIRFKDAGVDSTGRKFDFVVGKLQLNVWWLGLVNFDAKSLFVSPMQNRHGCGIICCHGCGTARASAYRLPTLWM